VVPEVARPVLLQPTAALAQTVLLVPVALVAVRLEPARAVQDQLLDLELTASPTVSVVEAAVAVASAPLFLEATADGPEAAAREAATERHRLADREQLVS